MMYTWLQDRRERRVRHPEFRSLSEIWLAAGKDMPWTGDTLNGSATPGAGRVIWPNAQEVKPSAGTATPVRQQLHPCAPHGLGMAKGIIRPVRRTGTNEPLRRRRAENRDTDGRWSRSRSGGMPQILLRKDTNNNAIFTLYVW